MLAHVTCSGDVHSSYKPPHLGLKWFIHLQEWDRLQDTEAKLFNNCGLMLKIRRAMQNVSASPQY